MSYFVCNLNPLSYYFTISRCAEVSELCSSSVLDKRHFCLFCIPFPDWVEIRRAALTNAPTLKAQTCLFQRITFWNDLMTWWHDCHVTLHISNIIILFFFGGDSKWTAHFRWSHGEWCLFCILSFYPCCSQDFQLLFLFLEMTVSEIVSSLTHARATHSVRPWHVFKNLQSIL